jgi:GT2 family glycosyltransferase
MPDVSIVIVNYNTRDKLRICLDSILQQRGSLAIETLVIDNGSKDGSPDLVRSYAPDITLIEPGYNSWFSGGNNIGIHSAHAEFVWVLNPDTILQPGTLQTMLAYLHSHPQVGAVSCRMEYPQGGLQSTCSMTPRYPDLLLGYTFLGVLLAPLRNQRRQKMWYAGWQRDSDRAVEVLPGSNLLARRALLMQIAAFDEVLRLYFVEDDICRRMLNTGSVEQVQRLASQIYFDDLVAFCRKTYGTPAALLLQVLMTPTRWLMDLAQRLRGEKKSL